LVITISDNIFVKNLFSYLNNLVSLSGSLGFFIIFVFVLSNLAFAPEN